MFARAGMLSPDGRCKALDAAADGYVRGEAYLAVHLGGLQHEDADGVLGDAAALLRSTALTQDGRSSSLTAPNGPAQQLAIRLALGSAGLMAEDMRAVQMHGTGTSLGGSPPTVHLPQPAFCC